MSDQPAAYGENFSDLKASITDEITRCLCIPKEALDAPIDPGYSRARMVMAWQREQSRREKEWLAALFQPVATALWRSIFKATFKAEFKAWKKRHPKPRKFPLRTRSHRGARRRRAKLRTSLFLKAPHAPTR